MLCEPVERRLDRGVVLERRGRRAEVGEPGATKPVRSEEAVDIGPGDQSVRRARAIEAAAEIDDRTGAVRARSAPHVDFIAGHGFSGFDVPAGHRDSVFVS
jgi:hypothetical protein